MQRFMTANKLYTQRQYLAALIQLEKANALMPDLYPVLHLCGMCKAELEQYENAISDLTGRVHYCNALYSRGMCHLNLGNHEKAFDDILRADELDSRSGEDFFGKMEVFAATDPSNPLVQKINAELCTALKRRKMNSLKVMSLLHAPSCWSTLRAKFAIDTLSSSLASSSCFVLFWCLHCTHPHLWDQSR